MKKILFLIIGLSLCSSVFGQVPNTFVDATVAEASEVNENFDYFETKFSTTGGHHHTGSDSKTVTLLGTVTTGTWQATIVDENYGGTGNTNDYSTGDLLQATADSVLGVLSPGTANYPLTSNGALQPLSYNQVVNAGIANSTIDLTAKVTGVLPEANGGTGSDFSSTAQGNTLYFSGTGTIAALGPGTDGYFLQTQGAAANPIWADTKNVFFKQAAYVQDADYHGQVEIINFSMGDAMLAQSVEFSYLGKAVALTSLGSGDLVDGKVTRQCFDFDGTNDYATITEDVAWAGMAALSFEVWIYRDTAGNTDQIFSIDDTGGGGGEMRMNITNTNIAGNINGTVGNEAWNVAHGLSGNGINQWVHIVVAVTLGTAADIYVNGVDVGDGDGSGSGVVADGSDNMLVGSDPDQNNKFHGKINGLRMLARDMPVAEVLARYNAFK